MRYSFHCTSAIFTLVAYFVSSQEVKDKTAVAKPSAADEETQFIFVNASGKCMLYAKRIALTVINQTQFVRSGQKVESYVIPIKNLVDSTGAESSCNEYTGQITLNLQGSSGGPYNLKLDSLKVVLFFRRSEALGWWFVDKIDLSAMGSVIEPGGQFAETYNGSEVGGYIDGPKSFCYACGNQRPFVFYARPPSGAAAGAEDKVLVKYALNFTNLQIQPFSMLNKTLGRNWRGFTQDVYDCVPFMSIGVWMFLISVSILLCICISGVFMLSSLKANDRFDDIKGKPLVVNVRE